MNCNICNNTGIIVQNNELKNCSCVEEICQCDGKAPYYYYVEEKRELLQCPCAHSRQKLWKKNKLINESNIPVRYRLHTFRDFIETSESKSAIIAAKNLVKNFKTSQKGIYFLGQPGSGKTMLASIILTEIILRFDIPVQYLKISRDFFNRIRATFNKETSEYGQAENYFNSLAKKPVLMIDDFGVQSDTDWEQRTLYDLIDARYENQLLTIITSNKNPKEFKNLFDGRIYSRLASITTVILLTGTDYRLPQNQKKLFGNQNAFK